MSAAGILLGFGQHNAGRAGAALPAPGTAAFLGLCNAKPPGEDAEGDADEVWPHEVTSGCCIP